MLTSFFSKSKPFNFIVVSTYLIGSCFFCLFFEGNIEFSIPSTLKISTSVLTYLFLLFLLNFIVKKNKLTKNNTYSILFFSAFIMMFPMEFKENEMLFSNVFLLLAIRRILSLPSEINTEKKIVDASIWITIAALFNFWSILFFVILFVAVFQRASKNYKYILIPFVGFFSVLILATVYNLLVNDTFLWILELNTSVAFNFSKYKSGTLLIPILFLSFLFFIALLQKKFINTPLKEKSKYLLIFYTVLAGILLIIISPNKNGSEFIFIFAPLSIIATNYLEKVKKYWISETMLWTSVLLPVLIYFL